LVDAAVLVAEVVWVGGVARLSAHLLRLVGHCSASDQRRPLRFVVGERAHRLCPHRRTRTRTPISCAPPSRSTVAKLGTI
jgi:hypothetical protein